MRKTNRSTASGWEDSGPQDIIQDIHDAKELIKNASHHQTEPKIILSPPMYRCARKIMRENGLKTLSQLMSFLAAQVVKEDGSDRLFEILAAAHAGAPMPSRKDKSHES